MAVQLPDTDCRAFSSSTLVDHEQNLTYPFYAFEKGASSVLHLEKLILMNRTTTSDELGARDRARHARILRSSTTAGAVDFYLTGSFDPKLVGMTIQK